MSVSPLVRLSVCTLFLVAKRNSIRYAYVRPSVGWPVHWSVGPSRVFCSSNFSIDDRKKQSASKRSSSLIHTCTQTLTRMHTLIGGFATIGRVPALFLSCQEWGKRGKNDFLNLCSHSRLFFHSQSVFQSLSYSFFLHLFSTTFPS